MNGGYDDGYKACPCFWGKTPGSMVKQLASELQDLTGLTVLDMGCGEGKNAAFLANLGCLVRAVDISEFAIGNAKRAWGDVLNITWEVGDVRNLSFGPGQYNIVLAYGLLHCFRNEEEINDTVRKLQMATRPAGFNIVCALNDRFQQLDAHPGLEPCLVAHGRFLGLYSSWHLIRATDSDLIESHPHNLLEHRHSMTRILARKA